MNLIWLLNMRRLRSLLIFPLFFLSKSALSIDADREQIPVIAGSRIQFPRDSDCTVGLVLKKNGYWENVTAYKRAVRYILTADHCGRTGEDVRVGNSIIGTVVWRSGVSDLQLVQVPPFTRRYQHCFATSTGPYCSIGFTYEPRAVGKIMTTSRRVRGDVAIPITGTGHPSTNEVFCTSGAVTAWNCSWGLVDTPPAWLQPRILERTAESFAANVAYGDSGGPVASSSGVIYGIISAQGQHWSEHPNKMTCISSDLI